MPKYSMRTPAFSPKQSFGLQLQQKQRRLDLLNIANRTSRFLLLFTAVGLPILLVLSISTSMRSVRAQDMRGPEPRQASSNQNWFTPNIGSLDMLDLFASPEQWETARSSVQVFKFYKTQVGSEGWSCAVVANALCGPNHLQNIIAADAFAKLNAWGIDIAIDTFFAGPVESVEPLVCTSGERAVSLSLNGTANAIQNVHDNGGLVRYLAMDEPIRQWYPTQFYLLSGQTDPRPCLTNSLGVLADYVAEYILFIKDALPSIEIGHVELYPEVGVAQLKEWILLLEARGVTLSFLHLDVNGPRVAQYNELGIDVDIAADLLELKSFLADHNTALGVIITDLKWNGQLWEESEYDDDAYFSHTMEWVNELAPVADSIDHLVFQSWVFPFFTTGLGPKQIPRNLPDDDAGLATHTRLIASAIPILRPEPVIPAISTWGVVAMGLLLMALATLVCRAVPAPVIRTK